MIISNSNNNNNNNNWNNNNRIDNKKTTLIVLLESQPPIFCPNAIKFRSCHFKGHKSSSQSSLEMERELARARKARFIAYSTKKRRRVPKTAMT